MKNTWKFFSNFRRVEYKYYYWSTIFRISIVLDESRGNRFAWSYFLFSLTRYTVTETRVPEKIRNKEKTKRNTSDDAVSRRLPPPPPSPKESSVRRLSRRTNVPETKPTRRTRISLSCRFSRSSLYYYDNHINYLSHQTVTRRRSPHPYPRTCAYSTLLHALWVCAAIEKTRRDIKKSKEH